jgi:hypothetical protein
VEKGEEGEGEREGVDEVWKRGAKREKGGGENKGGGEESEGGGCGNG